MKSKIFILIISALALLSLITSCNKESTPSTNNSTGKGGSLARFTIYNDYLYAVTHDSLKVIHIADKDNPTLVSSQIISFSNDIETIYPFNNLLFIGSQTAMYIYSLDNPQNPILSGTASHVSSCDPVVANDSIAFVTLRNGTSCNASGINQLQIYDIKNINAPTRLSTYDLEAPYGLALKGHILYVCDDKLGLVIFDVSDPFHIKETNTIKGYNLRDCIVHDKILVCMNEKGMIIYDISRPENPQFITEVLE